MRKIFFLLCLGLVGAASTASAATIYLKGGGRLDGAVVSQTGREVVIDTAQGRVSVAADRIERIENPVAPAPAAAEPAPRREVREPFAFDRNTDVLSLAFGIDAPLSDINFNEAGGASANNGSVGALIGVQYLHLLSPRLGLGAEFDYADRSATDSPELLPLSNSHVYGDTLLLMGVAKYSLIERGSVRPYVLVGVGAHRTSVTVNSRPVPGFAWSDTGTDERRRLIDDSAMGAAASARLGLDFGASDAGQFSLEAGWTVLSGETYDATPQGRDLGVTSVSGPLHLFTLALRWGWGF